MDLKLRENPENGIIYDLNDPGRVTGYELKRPLLADESNLKQRVVIADLVRFGVSCWISLGCERMQLSQQFATADEHWFHQAEVHSTLLAHGNPKGVLTLGGGDFLINWRVLQHPSVKFVKQADWDHMVSEIALREVPLIRRIQTCYRGKAYRIHQDPRLEWREEVDVREYIPWVFKRKTKFDVIIGDLTADSLETILPGALRVIRELLSPGGVYVYQAGPYSLAPSSFKDTKREIERMKEVFGKNSVTLSSYPIESFAYPQAWIAGWHGKTEMQSWVPSAKAVARIDVRGDRPFYSREIHRKLFTLEPEFADLLK